MLYVVSYVCVYVCVFGLFCSPCLTLARPFAQLQAEQQQLENGAKARAAKQERERDQRAADRKADLEKQVRIVCTPMSVCVCPSVFRSVCGQRESMRPRATVSTHPASPLSLLLVHRRSCGTR